MYHTIFPHRKIARFHVTMYQSDLCSSSRFGKSTKRTHDQTEGTFVIIKMTKWMIIILRWNCWKLFAIYVVWFSFFRCWINSELQLDANKKDLRRWNSWSNGTMFVFLFLVWIDNTEQRTERRKLRCRNRSSFFLHYPTHSLCRTLAYNKHPWISTASMTMKSWLLILVLQFHSFSLDTTYFPNRFAMIKCFCWCAPLIRAKPFYNERKARKNIKSSFVCELL